MTTDHFQEAESPTHSITLNRSQDEKLAGDIR